MGKRNCIDVPEDWRHISNGSVIPTENYFDQPYIVETADGAWLCAITTGTGVEGQRGQYVVMKSLLRWGRPRKCWNMTRRAILVRIKDPMGVVTKSEYDLLGRLVKFYCQIVAKNI